MNQELWTTANCHSRTEPVLDLLRERANSFLIDREAIHDPVIQLTQRQDPGSQVAVRDDKYIIPAYEKSLR